MPSDPVTRLARARRFTSKRRVARNASADPANQPGEPALQISKIQSETVTDAATLDRHAMAAALFIQSVGQVWPGATLRRYTMKSAFTKCWKCQRPDDWRLFHTCVNKPLTGGVQ